jgi:hypothetical protein
VCNGAIAPYSLEVIHQGPRVGPYFDHGNAALFLRCCCGRSFPPMTVDLSSVTNGPGRIPSIIYVKGMITEAPTSPVL